MQCPSCGREMTALSRNRVGCTNVQCPSIRWRGVHEDSADVVELTPSVERDRAAAGSEFLGRLYVKEIRVIEGCRCQGVSLSTVAAGEDKKEVLARTLNVAKDRAQTYQLRGYQVMLRKVA